MDKVLTKGFIRNLTTKVTKYFMYNPTEIQYRRSATYTDISAPGSPYPRLAFVKGDATIIPLNLMLFSREEGVVSEFITFMDGLLPEENSTATFKKPPLCTVSLGHIIKTCVLTSLDVRILDHSKQGSPIRAEISAELKVVA